MFSVLQALILSVPTFGSILLPTTLWIRSSAPLGTDFAPLHSVGLSPLLSPSLASGIGSLRYVYEAWKAGNLSKATLRDISSTESCNTYFSTPPSYSLVTSPRSRFGLSLAGISGFSFGARYGCVYWLFLDFFFQVTESAITVSNKFESAPGPFAAEGRCFIRGDWRSTWSAERQVCVLSVSLFV